ncbi:MAG: glycoside hydrolase family 95 protein, partial [Opitutales bacterium]|nr:glycoside hydrolase family 95 protein [Opitutales bacterium]
MKKPISGIFFTLAIAALLQAAPKIKSENWIWSDVPAQSFNADWSIPADNVGAGKGWEPEGYPVGNGRIGAMILGNAERERIALNEISLWTGGENAGGNCSGYSYGPTAGRNAFGSYQPFGDLLIESPELDAPKDFVRALSLAEGIAYTSFKKDGVEYTREVFASTPQDVIAVVYRASKKGKITANIALSPNHTAKLSASGNVLTMSGTLANDLNFAAHVSVIAEGGTVSASGGSEKIDVSYAGKGDNMQADFDRNKLPKISVKNADSLVILVAMNTDYEMNEKKNWKGADPVKTSAGTIAAAAKLPADAMRKKHVAAHAKLFNRCKIDLGETDKKTAALPTAQRIKNYATSKDDPDLEETLFQFGRYALMSSSKNSLPANLQGLWNHKVHAPWASDYHNN